MCISSYLFCSALGVRAEAASAAAALIEQAGLDSA
ncbi:hypothetical protein [Polaromonas sp. UBA4122]